MSRSRLQWLVTVALVALFVTLGVAQQVPQQLAMLARQGVDFASPGLLWLAVLAWLVPLAVRWSLTDLPRWQQAVQVLVRMALIVLLAVAIAGPRLLHERPRRAQVVHVIDRSASVPDALLLAAEKGVQASEIAVRRGDKERRDDALDASDRQIPPVQVIAFDREALTLPWPPTPAQPEVAQPTIARRPDAERETDLASALNLALGLLDGHSVPHIVIWSDGLETQGDALQLIDALKAAGARVHVPAQQEMPTTGEVVVERFELPAKVRANVPFPVAIALQSSGPAKVRCSLDVHNQPPQRIEQAIPAGTTRLDFGLVRLKDAGTHELETTCEVLAGADRFLLNNHLRGRVAVLVRPRLLYVEGAKGQSAYLSRALTDDFEVEIAEADGLPRSLGGLKPYQAILLSDVPRVSHSGVPLLTDGDMRNLEAYVKGGGGLLVLGGENSLGSGGYQDTYLDKHVLPVRMDVEATMETPTIALMLAVDRSGSMQGPKMELAKEAARATAESLAAEDLIGVVAFDSEARLTVRLQRAGNRYRISTDISKLSANGGTHIYPALDMAYQTLLTAPAKIKHVILLTDGQAPRQGIDALVRQMKRSGITVSTVGVGSDVDHNLLESIADRGGGRFYFTDRPETLPRIFVKETKLIAGESVIEQRVHARRAPGLGRIDLLRGVRIEDAPLLTGYLPTKVKPGAEEILRVSSGKPLLVRWKLGLGKVTVFTSDLKNRWAAQWLDWPGYPLLARQMVRDLLQEDVGMALDVRLARERDRLRVAVDALDEDDHYLTGMLAQAKVTRPDGTVVDMALTEVAQGRYETAVPLAELGPYDVAVTLRARADQPVLASGRATAVHPYPDEYRLSDGKSALLAELAVTTGGKLASQPADWLDNHGATHKDWQWLWPQLVWSALGLLLLDLLLRRVRLGRVKAVRWHALRRKK
jgi:Ca-activated chloride channel family protein